MKRQKLLTKNMIMCSPVMQFKFVFVNEKSEGKYSSVFEESLSAGPDLSSWSEPA
jgi:hypothetical protein